MSDPAEAVNTSFACDVAFSFLSRDLPIARALAERLSAGDQIVAVIRPRAQDAGASLASLTALDVADQEMRRERSHEKRRALLESAQGVALAEVEVGRLGEEIVRLVERIREQHPDLDIRAEAVRRMTYVASPEVGTAAVWELDRGNTLRDARLEVDDVEGVMPLTSHRADDSSVLRTVSYVPSVNEALELRWLEEPRPDENREGSLVRDGGLSTDALADEIVRRHLTRFFASRR